MEKGVVLKNYLDGTTTVDTLHFQAEQSDCKEKCCISSIVEPDQFKNREDEVPSPLKVKTDALKFLEEYYQSINGLNSPSYSKRITQVLKEIEKHGSYDLTEAELGFGTRLAWRNAPRCIGRIHWKTLQVFDCRHVTNAQQMFECCLQHIQFATNNGKIRSAISIFPPRKQKNSDFRIWNTQLIRYAGYLQSDGTVIGDPANIEVTQVAQHLGWVGKGTMFDVLPLIIQANGGQPEIFEIPKEYVLEVDIKHPKFHELNQLNLRWYAVPIVCNMALDCGGLRFTAAPFNGWYMSTEISVRNFGDKNRYNLLKKVARLLGFDTSLRTSLWKDRALIELTEATLHSYQEAGVTMVDHQSTAESFIRHFQKENKLRGGCPSDWVWIVPPISGSTCPVFHQEMLNYKLKPGYDYQVNPCKNFIKPLSQLEIHSNQHSEQVTSTIDHINLKNMAKHNVTILFASETGRAETFANNLRKLFCNTFNSNVVCMDQYKHEDLKKERCILVVASTSGNGEAPENGEEFSKFLHEKVHQSSRVVGLCFSIFGLGSRAYTNFCAFANLIEKLLNLLGGKQFYPIGYGDELNGQEEAFKNWSKGCFKAVCKLFSESDVDLPKFDLKSSIEDVQIIEHENVKETTLQKELMCFHCKDISLCKVKTVKNLQAKESSSVTDLVCFDISNNKQFSFQPGDHLGIYPCNSLKMVEKLINRATTNKFSSSTVVDIIDKKNNGFSSSDNISKIKKMLPNTLGLIFMWFKDITTPPSMLLLRAFAERCNEQRQKETLLKLANNRSFYQYWISRKYPSILQVLEEFPSVEVDLLLLISELPVLKPRYYSISSSPDLHPNEIHITVALINFVADGIYHSGVCSSWLHSRKPGDEVYCFLKSAPHFHLPSDPSAPIIMVGPGTGIAPFRSFWQQKTFDILQKKNTFGKMILFFGCRNKHLDNIFCYELEKAKSEGSLTEVFLGYSRDPEEPKTYVQQLLKANMEMVKNCILKDGGHFYVCGNVTMALSVKNILIDAIKDCFVYSHDECISPVDDLKKQGRFHEDIFLSEVDS